MSIISVDELFEQRSGAWTSDEGRAYTRAFRVISNNQYDGPNVAIQSVGINRGDQYLPGGSDAGAELDPNAYALNLNASPEDGDGVGWIVTIQYGPYSALWAGGGPTQNPLLQPIDVSWSTRSQEVIVDIDVNGSPILNTAGDPFDPPLMEDDPRPVLTVVRNEAIFNQALQNQYRNAVNSDFFAGYDPLMVRVLSIDPKSLFHQDVGWYYQTSYEFECRPATSQVTGLNGYRRTVLNQGMRAISSTGAKYVPTFKGVPITEPVLLTQKGTLAGSSDSPYWNVFQTKPELPFSVFQFDPIALIGQRSGFIGGYGSPYSDGGS